MERLLEVTDPRALKSRIQDATSLLTPEELKELKAHLLNRARGTSTSSPLKVLVEVEEGEAAEGGGAGEEEPPGDLRRGHREDLRGGRG